MSIYRIVVLAVCIAGLLIGGALLAKHSPAVQPGTGSYSEF